MHSRNDRGIPETGILVRSTAHDDVVEPLPLRTAMAAAVICVYNMLSITVLSSAYQPMSFDGILYALVFFRKTQKAFEKSDQAEGEMTADVQENLSGIRVVKAFGRERYEIDRFTGRNKEFRDLTAEVIRLLGRYWGVSDLLCLFQILAVLICGIFMVRNGSIALGSFFIFLTYESNMIYPIRNLGRILADMGKMIVSAGRIADVMSEQEEDVESGIAPEIKGDIVFDHVGFHYDDDPTPVLHDVSFSLKKGQVLAIIGPTGSGKSSLVHLLSRLYDCTDGTIYIDGHDIKSIQKDYLRHKIGIVLQEPYLYSRSIYENISIGQNDSHMDRVRSAAKIASVDEVIESFGQGYSTLVGEKGVTLSGGQKQRIAIARTIMNDTPILVFDDSLSAVDTETDAAIRHAIHALQKNVSMIIITQRIDSAKDADEIIVLENGTITEQGTHEELASRNGLYRRINEIQSDLELEGSDQ
ncbi:MAG: ABC transporter ATP-binding protein [Erysipelotrichia bacterium]|nr:ABC transporter ATP-binding protein [Erysipelotrichia bacterium]